MKSEPKFAYVSVESLGQLRFDDVIPVDVALVHAASKAEHNNSFVMPVGRVRGANRRPAKYVETSGSEIHSRVIAST